MGKFGNMPHGAAHDVAGRPEAAIVAALGPRTVTLVGMMGAGKSSIGRRLALRLGIPFVDADVEIEKAAGMTINDIFAVRGEAVVPRARRASSCACWRAAPRSWRPVAEVIGFRIPECLFSMHAPGRR